MATNLGEQQFVTLASVIAMFLDEHGKSDGDQDECWLVGMRGLTECNYEIAAQPKTLRIPLLGNKTIKFPPDLLQWTKIGILNAQQEVVTLKINNGLTTFMDTNPNRISLLTPDVNNSVNSLVYAPYYFNYYYNGSFFNLFGVGGGLVQYGECTVDAKNRVILFPADFKYDHVILEYITAPERDADFLVPLALREAIIAFIAWKKKLGTRDEFYAQLTISRRRMPKKKVSLQEVNQVLREPNTMMLRS